MAPLGGNCLRRQRVVVKTQMKATASKRDVDGSRMRSSGTRHGGSDVPVVDPWSEKLGRIHPLRLTQGPIPYRQRGSGPQIVFVHGFLTNAVVWSKVVPRIAAE